MVAVLPSEIIWGHVLPKLSPDSFTELFLESLYAKEEKLINEFLIPAYKFGSPGLLTCKEAILHFCVNNMEYQKAMNIIGAIYKKGSCLNITLGNILVSCGDARYLNYFLHRCESCNKLICNSFMDSTSSSIMYKMFASGQLMPTFRCILYLLLNYDRFGMEIVMRCLERNPLILDNLSKESHRFANVILSETSGRRLYEKTNSDRDLHLAYMISVKLDMINFTDVYGRWIEDSVDKLSTLLKCTCLKYAITDITSIIEGLEDADNMNDYMYDDF